MTALQDFWRAQFPAAFGRPWTDITGFVPVRTTQPGASTPPCLRRAADLADQAFYCPAADVVAWDADRLLPQQVEKFGAAGAVVVIAHEVGHAVHRRLGIDAQRARNPARYPTILLESMADCFAGVALAHFVDQPVDGLPIGLDERDQALLALVGFRDPLGVDAGDASAHGNAFDRVSAFQTGYADGRRALRRDDAGQPDVHPAPVRLGRRPGPPRQPPAGRAARGVRAGRPPLVQQRRGHPGARLAGAAARTRPRPAPDAPPRRRDRRCSAPRTGRSR